MKKPILLDVSMLLLSAAGVAATRDGVRAVDAWSRATPAVAPVAGGFLTLVNDGDKDDRLLRVESAVAERVELHEMRHENGVMRMRELSDGLVVPAHGKVELRPGGYHLMFIKPKRAFAEGERVEATLVFQRAGRVKVGFAVRAMGAGAAH